MFCALLGQVSVYRTIGPLVFISKDRICIAKAVCISPFYCFI